jgi:hypothetical protein
METKMREMTPRRTAAKRPIAMYVFRMRVWMSPDDPSSSPIAPVRSEEEPDAVCGRPEAGQSLLPEEKPPFICRLKVSHNTQHGRERGPTK